MLSKTNIFEKGWIELVFDGRNHQYGAFVIRRQSRHNTVIAMLLVISLFTAALATPVILARFKKTSVVLSGYYDPDLKVLDGPKIFEITPPAPPAGSKAASATNNSGRQVIKENINETEMPDTNANKTIGKANDTATDTNGLTGTGGEGPANSKGTDTVGRGGEGVNNNTIEDWVSIMPEFPGGDPALQKFIKDRIFYPPLAREYGTEGTVVVSAVVERDGSLSNIKVISKWLGDGLEEESIRLVNMLPRFKPGSNNNVPVRVRVNIPFKYRLR